MRGQGLVSIPTGTQNSTISDFLITGLSGILWQVGRFDPCSRAEKACRKSRVEFASHHPPPHPRRGRRVSSTPRPPSWQPETQAGPPRFGRPAEGRPEDVLGPSRGGSVRLARSGRQGAGGEPTRIVLWSRAFTPSHLESMPPAPWYQPPRPWARALWLVRGSYTVRLVHARAREHATGAPRGDAVQSVTPDAHARQMSPSLETCVPRSLLTGTRSFQSLSRFIMGWKLFLAILLVFPFFSFLLCAYTI